jgi:uncharacterized protein (DUF2237 family)
MSEQFNVLNTPLQVCGSSPRTGFYRDGSCRTHEQDSGRHTVCAIVSDEFLQYSKSDGNDLITPMPQYDFPGLKAGDRWCLCANRWKQAQAAGVAPKILLEASHEKSLEIIELDTLLMYAVDIPVNA